MVDKALILASTINMHGKVQQPPRLAAAAESTSLRTDCSLSPALHTIISYTTKDSVSSEKKYTIKILLPMNSRYRREFENRPANETKKVERKCQPSPGCSIGGAVSKDETIHRRLTLNHLIEEKNNPSHTEHTHCTY